MALDNATVAKIARLSRIELNDAEKEHMAAELSGIITWIEQLAEVNTDGVPILSNVTGLSSVSETALPWRKDEVTDGHKRDDILANAPMSEYGCFVVPKVIE